MRHAILFASAFVAAALLGTPAHAQTTDVGQITMIRTGWNADSFAIILNVANSNPAHCGTADGYISDTSLPGYRTYYAAALTAYATRQPVMVVIDNTQCWGNRPKIIGVNLTR